MAEVWNPMTKSFSSKEDLERMQEERGLFADVLHAGDIIRGIAHQGFDVDQLLRFNAVGFQEERLPLKVMRVGMMALSSTPKRVPIM